MQVPLTLPPLPSRLLKRLPKKAMTSTSFQKPSSLRLSFRTTNWSELVCPYNHPSASKDVLLQQKGFPADGINKAMTRWSAQVSVASLGHPGTHFKLGTRLTATFLQAPVSTRSICLVVWRVSWVTRIERNMPWLRLVRERKPIQIRYFLSLANFILALAVHTSNPLEVKYTRYPRQISKMRDGKSP
jgi:hypothetical protein